LQIYIDSRLDKQFGQVCETQVNNMSVFTEVVLTICAANLINHQLLQIKHAASVCLVSDN